MAGYQIGISGLDAAQKALEIIGNNIANAATEGYHRQRIDLSPTYTTQYGPVLLGGGVDITGVTRIIDNLLEQEILRQQSLSGQISQELITLQTVENAFGEFSTGSNLSAIIDNFFNALQDLCAHPGESIWQNQAVTAAQALAGQFRTLGEFLTSLEIQIKLEAENTVEQINTLINRIAELNDRIETMEISGGQANNLRDQRDQAITELSEFISLETRTRDYGVVDVSVSGIPVVVGTSATELESGLKENGELGISVAEGYNYSSDIQGGRLGALLSLKNDLISDIHSDLDSLASAIIQQINQYHVEGAGSQGAFTELTGWANTSGDLSDFSAVSAGYVYIRVTNTSTGAITRTAIPVLQDTSSDTLSEVAAAISAVTGVSATVNSSNKLAITADTKYTFDFIPAVLPEPTASVLNGASPPTITVSGIYTESDNDTFTFTVSGDGTVGNGTLQLVVTDSGAGSIATLNIGSGYAAGERKVVGDTGIYISLTTGDLAQSNNDYFEVDVFADTDTSGLLAAAGVNTLFSGSSASDMAVCSEISSTPSRIATSLGGDMTDNTNAVRMAGLKDQALSSLNSLTPEDFYRQMVTNIGQDISIKQMRQDNIEVIVQNLANQQSDISGVDINDEAVQMIVFEQMFQAMAKYLNTIQSTMSSIMELI